MIFTIGEIAYFDLIQNGISKLDNNSSEDARIARLEVILDSIIFAIIGIKVFVAACCGQRVSFGLMIIWIIAEIFVVQILCFINIKNWALNLSAFLLCIGSSGTYLVWGTLRKQMSLACLGMTLKEEHSRM